MREFSIIKHRWIFLIFSAILVFASIFSLTVWGLKLGVEFKGGSLMAVKFDDKVPAREELISVLSSEDLGDITVQPSDNKTLILKFKSVDEDTHQEVLKKIKDLAPGEESQFTSIGPVVGKELEQKSALAIALAVICIMLYIAWAFRRVSKPISSWQYGLIVAIVALLHDVIIPLGLFAALGYFMNIEINVAFVAAILTILGFSVHDTIVVFDRTRENLRKIFDKSFGEIVNTSLNQTLGRSLATSITVLLTIGAIGLWGGSAIADFALVLFVGIAVGTYSSIFVAGPLLIELQRVKVFMGGLRNKRRNRRYR
ncbi:MAG: protein-export membrane protein SecF [Candidatus Terrybacteria bacterium RIFCSPLOWO2_01_FULL_44_24]|uniref:Protein-export membrane protein SecF n=1 Tax=Candidatus Terrybacteria bacterium RIFCSPHIGHO2_01_FULL_43_35 TaxID=1802361 RepID=A0A1G2PFB9_9BACT|nr:MAG: protein-export membrane protein SecF [Candidatus Terrybacteria bacterium RIFCSPHIGHO2_01_FULL_43_35]OHA50420.1 MAG: protein-export membrane protein SecF [Candidatus Terrybacteria bacterium RIFCSPHIGHO2_02_FULL_43_14]OHA51709.1 MAG: protein-export membrane protein SecF [Candidatus Terrybacteria bacterium RIFCSPLOWO2_01_FULL_44_24]